MSDASEKEVSPLRLKRPGAPVPPPPSAPSAPDMAGDPFATIPPSVPGVPGASGVTPAAPSPVVPLPGFGAPLPPLEPAAPPARRRPTLSPELLAKTPITTPAEPIPGDMLIGALPGATPPTISSPVVLPPSAAEGVPSPVKLRIGAKPAPPPPAPIPGLPDDPFAGSDGMPLVPLPGLPAMSSLAPLPPLPGQSMPPMGARPQGTVPISGGGAGTKVPGFKIANADAPLMPLGMTGATNAPFPGAPGSPPPLPGRVKKAKSHSARRDLMLFVLIFLLLAAGGAGAYFYLIKPEASAEVLAGVKDKLEKAAEMPGKAVDNAKESMANARSTEQDRIDSVMEGRETPDKRGIPGAGGGDLAAKLQAANGSTEGGSGTAAANTVGPRPPTEKVANQVSAVVAPVPTEATGVPNANTQAPVVPAVPVAGARFVRYAEGLSVSGVFQGNPARALVDGRIVRSGDLLEPVQGIKFVGVDAATKHLILQDSSGAQLRVKY